MQILRRCGGILKQYCRIWSHIYDVNRGKSGDIHISCIAWPHIYDIKGRKPENIHSYMVTYLWHQSLNSNSHIFDIKERKSRILSFIWSHIHGINTRKSKDIYISVHIFMTLKEENMSICC